eukprot:1140919-Pelagomonas_calceolata.AAC.2
MDIGGDGNMTSKSLHMRQTGLYPLKEKENYVGRGNPPYRVSWKGDTLAQKSRESHPPQSCKMKRHIGSEEP